MSSLTADERELIIRVNDSRRDMVEIDVSIPKYRRQLERWGFKPLFTDSFGGARFEIPIKELKPMSRRKKGKPMSDARKKKVAAAFAKARDKKV